MTAEIAEERVAGDVWLWTAIDADTKSYLAGFSESETQEPPLNS